MLAMAESGLKALRSLAWIWRMSILLVLLCGTPTIGVGFRSGVVTKGTSIDSWPLRLQPARSYPSAVVTRLATNATIERSIKAIVKSSCTRSIRPWLA